MSESAASPALAQHTQRTIARARRHRLSPLEALERGFALFQSTFAREAWRYYVGAAPLVVLFIPMWVINGQIRLSDGTLLMEALLLGGAYLLRVVMVGSYVSGVRERAFGVPRPRFAGALARVAAVGRLLAWKITTRHANSQDLRPWMTPPSGIRFVAAWRWRASGTAAAYCCS